MTTDEASGDEPAGSTVDAGPVVRKWTENPYYWTLDDEPTLLVGGSPKDNLYQHVGNPDIDVEGALDDLVDAGGNYVRHTMQSRATDAEAEYVVQPFERVADGRYDLEAFSDEYWERFSTVLEWTADRDIVVQVTFWDRFDFADLRNDDHYRKRNPWNPANNVNYTQEDTGLPTEWDRHPAQLIHRFMFAPEDGNSVLLDHQQRYVRTVLEHTLNYDHVLYNVSNETRAPKSWGDYWADFVTDLAESAGEDPVYVTQMYDEWNITAPRHDRTHEDPLTYDYVDVSQNNQEDGQEHYDNLVTVRDEFGDRPWPLNNVKCYGRDGGRHGSTRDGLERFWRSIFGGSASIRFHRPPSGHGIDETAQTHIRAAREVTDELDLATTEPRRYALRDRTDNEAYCLGDADIRLVFFTDGGSVVLDDDEFDPDGLRWYDVESNEWENVERIEADAPRLSAPGEGYWIALVAS